jgi:hypothetical protein
MRGGSNLKCALAGAAVAAVLAAGYVSVGYAAPAGGATSAGPTDTEPPPETTPAPDPAPPAPKPARKPAPKAVPKPAPKAAHVYHAPVQNSAPTPAPQPTYTPPPVQHVTKKAVHHARAHKRQHKRVQHVVTRPKVHAQVKHANVVKINGVPTAAVTTNPSDAIRRSLVIAGIGVAALLFLLVLAVPATAARFTPPGRVLMDHQTDLVLVGVAILLLTALVFAVTGNG